jgi:hypothetical protein
MAGPGTWFDRSALTWHEKFGPDDTGDVRYAGYLVRWRYRPRLRTVAHLTDGTPNTLNHDRERLTSVTDLAAPVAPTTADQGANPDSVTWDGLNTQWMDSGLCRQPAWRNAAIQFPPAKPGKDDRYVRPDWLAKSNTLAGRAAAQVCAACPATADCLDFALAGRLTAGTWGGVSTDERTAMLDADSAALRTLTAAC